MTDLDDEYRLGGVINSIDHSVVTLTYTIMFLSRELLTAVESWLIGESLDLGNDFAAILGRNSLQLFSSGRLDEKLIVCHAASDL